VATRRRRLGGSAAEPATYVARRPADDRAEVLLTGELEPELRRLVGLEVQVEGVSTEGPIPRETLDVLRFRVRAAGGMPAMDGILERDGDLYRLRLADGSREPIQSPPEALRRHGGARVWIAGPPDAPPASFGVIRPARSPAPPS
jgi:hypothetical protein